MTKSVVWVCFLVKRMIPWNRSEHSSAPDGFLHLLLRFSATVQKDGHFREEALESLEKVIVLTSKRHSRASENSGNLEFLKHMENLRFPSLCARPGARQQGVHFAIRLGSFKNGTMANGSHVSFNWSLSLRKMELWKLGVFRVPVYKLL